MEGLNLGNFYAPLVNFVVFVVLFFLAFRGVFKGMAKKQREEFLQAKLEAQAQQRAAEKQLDAMLFQERELAKKLHAIQEQAVVDSKNRAAQIIKDAEFHAAQILEESKRLVDAEYEKARQTLKAELLAHLEASITEQASKQLTSHNKQQYTKVKLEDLKAASAVS